MLVIPQNYIIKSILLPLLTIAVIEAILKWIALYKAWNRKDIARFICIFIFNTCWILPAIYLLLANNTTTNKNDMPQKNEIELPQKNNKSIQTDIKKVAKTTIKDVKTWKRTTSSKKSTKVASKKK